MNKCPEKRLERICKSSGGNYEIVVREKRNKNLDPNRYIEDANWGWDSVSRDGRAASLHKLIII